MIAFAFGAAAFGISHGWATDNGPEIIMGFLCVLLGASLVLARDVRHNHAVVYDIDKYRDVHTPLGRDNVA